MGGMGADSDGVVCMVMRVVGVRVVMEDVRGPSGDESSGEGGGREWMGLCRWW